MRQYETFELSFEGEKLVDSWAEVDLTATFTDKSGAKTIKGFYAGDGVYKVRYMPEVTGEVSWKVTGTVCAEGSEVCEPAAEGRHGIVRADGMTLKNADGSYFFSFGTTVYGLAHQNEEITEQTFETLAENPFNKVRMCVFPKHYDYNVNDPLYFPFEVAEGMEYKYDRGETFNSIEFMIDKAKLWDTSRPCFAFWDAFEEKIKRLDALGIQVDLIIFHPYDRWGFSCLEMEQNEEYLKYALARLSALPNVWWSLANEYDLMSYKSLEDWKTIEKIVAENDPYHHLLSNHNCQTVYDFSSEYITHCSLQKRTMTLTPEYRERYGKPVLYDECVYEGNTKQSWGSLTGAEMMNRFWKVTSHGGYCTHGEAFLDNDIENVDDAVLWWGKGGKLKGTSPKRIAFLRSIVEEVGAPFEPYNFGFSALVELGFKNEEIRKTLPSTLQKMIQNKVKMDPVERALMDAQETTFAGHTADNSHYLFYMGTDCFGRVDLEVASEAAYKVEVIDAWNMTRETILTGISGAFEVKLPGREFMAVLCTRE